MKYLLTRVKHSSDRVIEDRFEAENDIAAKLKMCAIAFGTLQEVQPLTAADEIMSYLLNVVFDEDDRDNMYDTLDSAADHPEAFTEYLLHEIFELDNGYDMDFFVSVENASTGETVWEAEEVVA